MCYFWNVLYSLPLKSQGYVHVPSLPCLSYYDLQYYKGPFSKILITSSQPINFSLMVRIDFRAAKMVISSIPWEIELLGKKATVGIVASFRACIPCLQMPSANSPRTVGARESPGGQGRGLWLYQAAWLSCLPLPRPSHPPKRSLVDCCDISMGTL